MDLNRRSGTAIHRLGLLLLAMGTLATATQAVASDEKTPKGDLAKLQGRWTGLAGPDENICVEYTFKDDDFELIATYPQGAEARIKGKLKLDEKAKPHKHVDWIKQTGAADQKLPDRPGIYVFEDNDTLKICTPGGRDGRPDKFYKSRGGGTGTIMLRRVDDEAEPKK